MCEPTGEFTNVTTQVQDPSNPKCEPRNQRTCVNYFYNMTSITAEPTSSDSNTDTSNSMSEKDDSYEQADSDLGSEEEAPEDLLPEEEAYERYVTQDETNTDDTLENAFVADTFDYYNSYCGMTYDPIPKLFRKFQEDPNQFLLMCSCFELRQKMITTSEDYLLPPKSHGDCRKTLVLDMDETLVHCFFASDEGPYNHTFTLESSDGLLDVFCRVRPYLDKFLQECSKMFEIVVFTASQERYASKVLDIVDPHGYIEHKLFRSHCTQVNETFVKDLSLLGRSLSQTVIVDNSPISFAFQPTNGIVCDDWVGDQRDCELLELIHILRLLNSAKDVRTELADVDHFLWFLKDKIAGDNNEFMWRGADTSGGE